MEANAKHSKKKRIAHMGDKTTSSLDEPKLPPDDYVYTIMKNMDSNNIVSYKQSQETMCKKRRLNEGHSTTENSYNKCAKNYLPKKPCPLMKKCQTSIKYLEKNLCIPKPKAHMNRILKPPVKPVRYAEKNVQKFDYGISNKASKTTKIQSKAYSKVLESTKTKNKIPESKSKVPESKSKVPESKSKVPESKSKVPESKSKKVYRHLSSSDDGDTEFENFVQVSKADNNDSSDSDSRLTICRNKSRNKTKQKRKLSSEDENSDPVPKITSIPLSDSSESESESAFEEINEKLKHKTNSLKSFQKRTSESYSKESLSKPSSDLDTYDNHSSSDEDFSVHSAALSNEINVASNVNKDFFNVNQESSSNIPNQETDHIMSSNSASLNNIESEGINIDTAISESNGVSSCSSKSVPKHKVPCYVRVQRDPVVDKKALAFISVTNSSEDNSILISEDSDVDEVCTTPHSTFLSTIDKTCLPLDIFQETQAKSDDVHNSVSATTESREDADTDDCVIICDVPKVITKSINSEILSLTAPSTSTKSNTQQLQKNTDINECENSKSETVDQISEKEDDTLPNSNEIDSVPVCHEDESENTGELNIVIVGVASLVATNELVKTNEIEVIDISDDESMENKNSEVVEELGVTDNLKLCVQDEKANSTEINSSEHLTKTCSESSVVGSNQNSFENSSVEEQNLPDPKIMEILNKINFDCIKEVINKTKLIDAASGAETSDFVLSTHPEPTIKSKNVENTISTNSESNFDKRIEVKRRAEDVDSRNAPCKSLKRNDGVIDLSDSTIKPSCISSPTNPMDLSSKINNSETGLVADISHKTELSNKSSVNNKSQANFQTAIETVPCQTNASTKIDAIVPNTVKALKHEDIVAEKYEMVNINKTIKYEIPETPTDDNLDALASSFIEDLNPPKKSVLSLLNLYQAEYEKYMQIKNTEVNVSAGLKLLQERQENILLSLRAAIKNVVRHDPCFYKVAQEHRKVRKSYPASSTKKEGIACSETGGQVKVKDNSCSASSSNERATSRSEIDSAGTSQEQLPRFPSYDWGQHGCATCGKMASGRCQGCNQVFYCSTACAELSWVQGHSAVCVKKD